MMRIARLLIVDDEPDVLDILSQLATAFLHHVLVETADSAFSALERIKATRYDVVLSDLLMPGMSGVDLAEHIRTISPCTPVIIMSGAPDLSDRVRGHDIFGFIAKPIHHQALIRVVSQAMAFGRAHDPFPDQPVQRVLALYPNCWRHGD
jgi:two-component system copper resistance phosphate regulon response regulator CusR